MSLPNQYWIATEQAGIYQRSDEPWPPRSPENQARLDAALVKLRERLDEIVRQARQ